MQLTSFRALTHGRTFEWFIWFTSKKVALVSVPTGHKLPSSCKVVYVSHLSRQIIKKLLFKKKQAFELMY